MIISHNMLHLLVLPYLVVGKLTILNSVTDKEDQRIMLLVDLVKSNLKTNGWRNIIIFGHFPDNLYLKLKTLPFTFVTSNTNDDDHYIEDVVPYYPNTILMNCVDFGHFEESFLQVMNLPYWHPHSHIYLYYHKRENEEKMARIFFIFWYYRACNVNLIQYDDAEELLFVTNYTPFLSDTYKLEFMYGCWTAKKIGMPVSTFEEGFICEKNCHNVTLSSKLRAANLGACIGAKTHVIKYNVKIASQGFNIFEDKGRNFHGHPFRSFVTEVLPFMHITEHPNNTYSLSGRDGMIWETISDLLNFTMDLSSNNIKRKTFDFEVSIKNVFSVAQRKGDLFLMPIYQFDVVVMDIDNTFAYRDSGACFMAHRAEFETILFDKNTLIDNFDIVIQFAASFFCIWIVFCLYSGAESKKFSMDFFGKNFMNTVRSILLINLYYPPKRKSFRLFLTIIIWSFFVINFSMQAAIISFFSAFKRGREVNTFEDIVEKGYVIQGLASPDAVLPETEETFRKINSKLSAIRDLFGCVQALSNDSHKFCLIDCSVGRYVEVNMLNKKGEQYLHMVHDRVHSYYLNFVFPKYSVLTEHFNKYLMIFFEAGLIKKWEDYRYNDIKEEVLTKPLGMSDVKGIFNVYLMLLAITSGIFFIELCIGNFVEIKHYFSLNTGKKTKNRRK